MRRGQIQGGRSTPKPPCDVFAMDDGTVGFLCHVGANRAEHILWRLDQKETRRG